MVNGQLVADGIKGFAQQTVIVKGTDQVFHDVVFMVIQTDHVHLLFQLVIERLRFSIDHLFTVFMR